MEILNICRLCGLHEELNIDIFEQGSEYPYLIHSLLPLRVKENDNLPHIMCYRCEYKLKEFYSFRERCVRTEEFLKSSQCKKEFCLPTGSDVKCTEKQCQDANKQFEERQQILSSTEREIITVDSRSPSPASDLDSTPKSALTPKAKSNCKSSTAAEEVVNDQTRKRKEPEECNVFLNSPDENANVNEIGTAGDSWRRLSVNKPKSEDSPVLGKRAKQPENSVLHASTVIGTKQGANLSKTAAKEGSESTSCVAKCVTNKTESVQQAGENNYLTTCTNYNSKQYINVPNSLIVTKIPGFHNVYTCAHCERTFTVMDSALNHDCDKNPVNCRYKCEFCGKTFSRQAILAAHQKCHFSSSSSDESA